MAAAKRYQVSFRGCLYEDLPGPAVLQLEEYALLRASAREKVSGDTDGFLVSSLVLPATSAGQRVDVLALSPKLKTKT